MPRAPQAAVLDTLNHSVYQGAQSCPEDFIRFQLFGTVTILLTVLTLSDVSLFTFMSQTFSDDTADPGGTASAVDTPPNSFLNEGFDESFQATQSQPVGHQTFVDSDHSQSRVGQQGQDEQPTVEDDIAAALRTDLDLSDAVPLEEVPAISLEEQVASALNRASSSLPHLSSTSHSLESFKSGRF